MKICPDFLVTFSATLHSCKSDNAYLVINCPLFYISSEGSFVGRIILLPSTHTNTHTHTHTHTHTPVFLNLCFKDRDDFGLLHIGGKALVKEEYGKKTDLQLWWQKIDEFFI